MFTIRDGGSLSRVLDTLANDDIQQLLLLRRDQLGGNIADIARFIIVQSRDSLEALEAELGFTIRSNAELSFGCEWVEDHGTFYEAVWILTDDGYAHVAFIAKQGVDPDLLKFCETHITATV